MPVTVIGQDKIERIGALRLNEVLTEQAGLQIISDHGTGVQFFGKRKPGAPELPAWTELVTGLQ